MSFAGDTKNSLCALHGKALHSKSKCCRSSMLYGMLLFSSLSPAGALRMVTENEASAKHLLWLLSDRLGIAGKMEIREKRKGSGEAFGSYKITVEEKSEREALRSFCASFGEDGQIDPSRFSCPDCLRSFARGAFLAAGTVADPKSGYHLDITATGRGVAEQFCALLADAGIPAKHTIRKTSSVVYFKESGAIEDFLTFIGAQQAALSMMNVSIYREIRNQENRRSNCDTANISKTVGSAARQLRAIRTLRESGRFDTVDEELRKTALLREQFPESSLQELAAAHTPPITKSGVNHRLKKLIELSESERT